MENLLVDIEKHVSALLNDALPSDFVYHNLSHTQRVVGAVKELVEAEKVSDSDANLLVIAAWFHDTGFIKDQENHEDHSVIIAKEYLKVNQLEKTQIDVVCQLILATKMHHEPTSLLERIIRDADTAHFPYKNYDEVAELLRREWELTSNKSFSEKEWISLNISFFTNEHRFYTNHALQNWQMGKDKNLAKLYKALNKIEKEVKKDKKKAEEFALKKNKATLPERGIETMFRVTLKNHITLSNIADTKANILLSVNAIIASLAMSNLIPKLDNPSNSYLIIPTVIFITFTVISIVLSILATRPNVTRGQFTKQDVIDKKVNLLFFGNFHRMKLDEFEWAMGELMKDKEYLYGSMSKDLYFLGLVLNKKYSILRTTYTVFMIGIIVSVLAFAISFYLQA